MTPCIERSSGHICSCALPAQDMMLAGGRVWRFVVLLLPPHAAGSILRFSEPNSAIEFSSSARVTATCLYNDNLAAVNHVAQGPGETATVHLINVAPTCASVPLSTPCASHAAGFPALFHCGYSRRSATPAWLAPPVQATASLVELSSPSGISSLAVDVSVTTTCRIPTFSELHDAGVLVGPVLQEALDMFTNEGPFDWAFNLSLGHGAIESITELSFAGARGGRTVNATIVPSLAELPASTWRLYTTPGTHTYTPAAGVRRVKVYVTGAGGAGGSQGPGGGAGGTAIKMVDLDGSGSQSFAVTVGDTATPPNGNGGSANDHAGGDSSFGTSIIGRGGQGGAGATASDETPALGGDAAGGDLNIPGGSGSTDRGGRGGGSFWGGGGICLTYQNLADGAGRGTGSGGRGGQSGIEGCSGDHGSVVIEEYA